MFGDPKVVDAA